MALILLAACGGGREEGGHPAARQTEKVVHVYNWAEYIGESTISDFEAKTGIKVIYDVYDSNELLQTKLLTGNSGYDVVFPSGAPLERLVMAGVFQRLDKSKLPNLVHLDAEILRIVSTYDPGNNHSIPYMWGTTGIGYNPDAVEQVLGTRTIDSWAAVFDPAIASKLAKCGIAMLDSPGDMLSVVRLYLGLDLNSKRTEDLAPAETVLMKVRPFVRYFDSFQYVSDLASGEICAAVGWSGGVLQARARGAQAAAPVEVAYAIPKEGAPMWFDMVAIPKDAPHPDHAHAFLNFLMEPTVIAAISNAVGQANANAAALPFVSETLRDDPLVYPTDEVRKRLHTDRLVSPEQGRMEDRAWARIKYGQ